MAVNEELEPGRFFLPGPTEVEPEVLEAQARPVMGHRGAQVQALVKELQAGLGEVFCSRRPVILSTSSATGLMEAAIRNGVRGKVLCLVNGAFSGRFAEIARACGKEVDTLEVPWGAVHRAGEVADAVEGRGYDAVTLAHSETSTGALNPVRAIALAVREAAPATLAIVDSVTGIGGAVLRTDDWDLDFVLTGSQKALALPPGLSFAVASEAMMARANNVHDRGFYFDLVRFQSNLVKHQTPTTPALTLMYALQAQLRRIHAEGMEARWERHAAMAARCHEWVGELRTGAGVEVGVLAPAGGRSPTVTCVTLPRDRTGPEVAAAMRRRGWVIGAGYGKLKETTVRIGHMGDHTVDRLEPLLEALGEVLTS